MDGIVEFFLNYYYLHFEGASLLRGDRARRSLACPAAHQSTVAPSNFHPKRSRLRASSSRRAKFLGTIVSLRNVAR